METAAIRDHLHAMWDAVAPAWDENADYTDARGAELTRAMLELTAPEPGERVLELACGAGGLGLAAAELVAPDGEVVLSDASEQMTLIADRRRAEKQLANVSSRVLDLESIDEPDASYDVVLCREGMMFAADPAAAARELARVLRPGGRFAVAVWGPREDNPWLGLVLDAVSAELGAPMPPPGVPGPFALSDRGQLRGLLDDAGFAELTVEAQPVPMRAPSLDEWWNRTAALAGPLAKVLASLPDETAAAIQARARAAACHYETAGGIDFPGVTLLAHGRR